jgi:hypothetical protein
MGKVGDRFASTFVMRTVSLISALSRHQLFGARRRMTAPRSSLKFCPSHLPAACDSKADSGKLSHDVFIGPKTLAHSNGLFLDGLNQARIIVSPARHIDAFPNWAAEPRRQPFQLARRLDPAAQARPACGHGFAA